MEVVETCFQEIKRFKLMTGFKSRKNIILPKRGYKNLKRKNIQITCFAVYGENCQLILIM